VNMRWKKTAAEVGVNFFSWERVLICSLKSKEIIFDN